MSAPKMLRIEGVEPRLRVTAPLSASAFSSTASSTNLLALTTAVRRHALSYCDNADLVLLYAASRAAAAAVVDHTRTTPLVVLAPPPPPPAASSSSAPRSTPTTMCKFAFELPFRYPSRSARLAIRALWATSVVVANGRSDVSAPIQRHREALAVFCAEAGRAERIAELTVDRHAVSGALLSRVGDHCTNLVRLHLVDGARPPRSSRTAPVAWPNDFAYGQESVHLGPCLGKRAPTLHALTLEFTDTPAGTEDASAMSALAILCQSLSNAIGPHLSAAHHLCELRMDAASTLPISHRAASFSAKSLAVDVAAAAAAETGDSEASNDHLPLQILQLRFLCASAPEWFDRHVAAQLAASAQHLREIDLEVAAGGVVVNSQIVVDDDGRERAAPDPPSVAMPHLVRLRLWALERSPSAPVDNPWRLLLSAPGLEELRCNVLARLHLDFVLERAVDNRLRVLEYAPPRHSDESLVQDALDIRDVRHEAARVRQRLERSSAFWAKHAAAGRVSRLERFSWQEAPLADDVLHLLAASAPAMRDFCAVAHDDRRDAERDRSRGADVRRASNMAAHLCRWPLLERLHLTTRDGNPADEATQRATVPLEELRRQCHGGSSSASTETTKPISPVRLDRLHTLAWDRLWSHDLDEWLHAPNLVHLGSVAAPVLIGLVPSTTHALSSSSWSSSTLSSLSTPPSAVLSDASTDALSPAHPHLATLALRIIAAPGHEMLPWPAGARERKDPSHTVYGRHERLQKLDVTLESASESELAPTTSTRGAAFAYADVLARAFGTRLAGLRVRLLGSCEPGAIAYEWPALVAALTRAAPHLPALTRLEIAVPEERRHEELTTSAVAESVCALGLALAPTLDRLDLPSITPSQLYEINRVLPRGVCSNLARVWSD